ncbi:MAG TPA: glycosyltransferase [Pedobacter sp.]|nr:glycosyltransferase [Pedobacter sp.]
MKRFLTLFPAAENVHLIKDVGMLPFMMHQELGYSATLACYNNGHYDYLHTEVKGLNLVFIKRFTGNAFLDGLFFLLRNARRYNILQVYHLTRAAQIWCFFFKFMSFGSAKTYLKLDADDSILTFKPSKWTAAISMALIKYIDLITVENTAYQTFLNEHNTLGRPVEYCPNGFYDDGQRSPVNFQDKVNTILTVGRIGTRQKATEVLLEGFRLFAQTDETWNLEIAGPIAPDFQEYITRFFQDHPKLESRIAFTGVITDRRALWEKYKRAKIFILSSRWEGFPLVFPEAMKAGCFILSTTLPAAIDVVNNNKFGSLFPIDEPEQLGRALTKTAVNENTLEQACAGIQQYGYANFYWPAICRRLNEFLS